MLSRGLPEELWCRPAMWVCEPHDCGPAWCQDHRAASLVLICPRPAQDLSSVSSIQWVSPSAPWSDTLRGGSGFQGWLGNVIVFPFIFKMQITLVSQKNHSVKNTFRINKCKKKRTHQDCNSCLLNIRFITKAQPRKIAFLPDFEEDTAVQLRCFPDRITLLCLVLLLKACPLITF